MTTHCEAGRGTRATRGGRGDADKLDGVELLHIQAAHRVAGSVGACQTVDQRCSRGESIVTRQQLLNRQMKILYSGTNNAPNWAFVLGCR
jgi:hypothetical protein